MSKKIEHLVVDTTAFLKAANLQDLGDTIYTIQEVVDEIKNDRQRRKLIVLPYELKIKDVFTENVKFVSEFSKKTGDYTSLSATDIKVIALTYQLEKEKIGTDHLKTEPTMQRTVKVSGMPGYSAVSQKDNEPDNLKPLCPDSETVQLDGNIQRINEKNTEFSKSIDNPQDLQNECDTDINDISLADQIKNINLEDHNDADELIVKISDEEETSSEDDSDSDGGEWITPSNLAEMKKDMDMGDFIDKYVEVACITSDFAMQNVLKQIGLNVTSIDGRIIRQLRTFIFRCTTCFKTTSVMTKLFCPKCGHATLRKVAVSIDDEGNQHIHINGRKPLTSKGKRFSLPTPRGGQHFQYPILTEDQHIHKRFATKLAQNKTNALDPDYTAGFSPFVMKDVNSKSAVLGVRANKQNVKYWMKNYSKGKKK